MFVFVLNITLLLFVFTLHNTLIVNPALLPKGNLTKILDILNGKLGTAKKNTTFVDENQSSLTEKEQKLMDLLMNRLYERVIDDGVGSDNAIDSRNGGVGKVEQKKKAFTGVSTVEAAVMAANRENPSSRADERDYAEYRPVTSASSFGKRHDVNSRPSVAKDAVAVAPRPPDPLLQRFARLADMLDRPDGINEAVQTMLTIPSFLNKSAVLDERCPFERLVDDDEELVSSIIKRLRHVPVFGPSYSGLVTN